MALVPDVLTWPQARLIALKVARQQRGLTLDENDLWVAATALALGATLVTRDGDFSGIPGLLAVAPH
jgi:predicted nucleic acid-binding protein